MPRQSSTVPSPKQDSSPTVSHKAQQQHHPLSVTSKEKDPTTTINPAISQTPFFQTAISICWSAIYWAAVSWLAIYWSWTGTWLWSSTLTIWQWRHETALAVKRTLVFLVSAYKEEENSYWE